MDAATLLVVPAVIEVADRLADHRAQRRNGGVLGVPGGSELVRRRRNPPFLVSSVEITAGQGRPSQVLHVVQRSGLRPEPTEPVLGGLNGQSIARCLTTAAKAAGIDGRISVTRRHRHGDTASKRCLNRQTPAPPSESAH